jgi:hypothetical protein
MANNVLRAPRYRAPGKYLPAGASFLAANDQAFGLVNRAFLLRTLHSPHNAAVCAPRA